MALQALLSSGDFRILTSLGSVFYNMILMKTFMDYLILNPHTQKPVLIGLESKSNNFSL